MQTEDYEYLYRLEGNFWWFAGMREITAALLDPFLPPGARVILDAGCGTGGNLEWLARYAGNGHIVGIDLISTALGFCRKQSHGRLVQASATDLPFADESFDMVTSFDVLVQIPRRGDSTVAAQTPRPRRRGVGRQTTASKSSMDQSRDDTRSVVGGEKAAESERETAGGPVGDLRRAETEWSLRLACGL